MKFFFTEAEALRLDAILTLEFEDENEDDLPCEVCLVGGKMWYLTREEGLRLFALLKDTNDL